MLYDFEHCLFISSYHSGYSKGKGRWREEGKGKRGCIIQYAIKCDGMHCIISCAISHYKLCQGCVESP